MEKVLDVIKGAPTASLPVSKFLRQSRTLMQGLATQQMCVKLLIPYGCA